MIITTIGRWHLTSWTAVADQAILRSYVIHLSSPTMLGATVLLEWKNSTLTLVFNHSCRGAWSHPSI